MTRSKYLYLLLAALVLSGAPAIAANGDINVITKYFYEIPFAAQFCADINPDVAGVPITFRGVTPWGITRTAGTAITNVFGTGCVKTIWAEGIYTLRASTNGTVSDPVAIAFWNPSYFCGAISAGELHLYQVGVFPNAQYTQNFRVASGAMIFREPSPFQRCPVYGVIYYDPDNPLGAVSFTTKSFTTLQRRDEGFYQAIDFWGTGYFQQGADPKQLVKYELTVDNYPDDNFFCLSVYDLTGKLLYENDDCHLFKGQTVVNLCVP